MPAAGKAQQAGRYASKVDYGHQDESLKSAESVFAEGMVDAINQIFSEFAFAYHNQFHKAFPDRESVAIAKEYWLSCLSQFTPRQITAAARKLVSNSEYMPTLPAVIKTCNSGLDLYGLPDAREAYLEACRAPTPKAAYQWSHAAVYHAGKASDWYVLANQSETVAWPIFAAHYERLCAQVIRGETLQVDVPKALTDTCSRRLNSEERSQQMSRLRQLLRES